MSAQLLELAFKEISARDKNYLGHWLRCPLHNRREDVRALYESLLRGKFDQEPNDLKARQVRSYLLDRLEAFLRWKYTERKDQKMEADLLQLRIYRQLGHHKLLENRINRCRSRSYGRADVAALHMQYEIGELHHELCTDRDDRAQAEHTDQLDRLLLAQTAAFLRQTCLTLAERRFKNAPLEVPLRSSYLGYVSDNQDLLSEPTIRLYYGICQLQQPSPLSSPPYSLVALREFFALNLTALTRSEQTVIIKLLLNLAIRRFNDEATDQNLRQVYQLYLLGLKKELLLEGGRLSAFTFNNIVSAALRLGETQVAHQTIENYAHLLPVDKHEEVMALNRARAAYQEGRLGDVISLLQEADYRDNIHHFNARGLLLRCYYELGELEPMRDLLRATLQLIRRRKVGYHQRLFLNNLQFMQKLVQLDMDDCEQVEELKLEIHNTTPLTFRNWLLKMLE